MKNTNLYRLQGQYRQFLKMEIDVFLFCYGEDHKMGLENPDYKKRVSEVKDDDANLKKLVAKRIDGILIDKYTGLYLAKQAGILDQLEVHPVYVNSDNVYIMFSQRRSHPWSSIKSTLRWMR